MADIVGFGIAGTYVSLPPAGHFAPNFELAQFGTGNGWASNDRIRASWRM